MLVEKTKQGAWCVSATINGRLESRRYMGFTKRQAIRLFKIETKGE